MASIEKFVAGAGVGLTWTDGGFTANAFNSLAIANVVVATTSVTNGTALDVMADFSCSLVNGATTTLATSYLELYLLPLMQDGSTYGDGTTSGSTLPLQTYSVGRSLVKTGVTNAAVVGLWRGVLLPPGDFRWAVSNQMAGPLNAAAVQAVKYRTYNFNLNG